MKAHKAKRSRLLRRKRRVHRHVRSSSDRPRLIVNRTCAHVYAQIVEDGTGRTLVTASTLHAGVREGLKNSSNVAAAKAVGKAIAEAAIAKEIKKVCFDRGGRKYHGRVKALADAAREAGLQF